MWTSSLITTFRCAEAPREGSPGLSRTSFIMYHALLDGHNRYEVCAKQSIEEGTPHTAVKLAAQGKVSRAPIERDADYAHDVNTIATVVDPFASHALYAIARTDLVTFCQK